MKTAMAAKPYMVECRPLLMFSAPSCGPMVRSSTMSIGADSAPERSSSASSAALSGVPMPVIRNLLPNSLSMRGADSTSGLSFFSYSTMAMRLPTRSRVASRMRRPPSPFSSRLTAGCWFWSKVAVALEMESPLSTTSLLTMTGTPLPTVSSSELYGTVAVSSVPGVMVSSTMRNSSVAVRPMTALARATSCTPGSWTTMRSAPCCWMTGSDTPSSLTRLDSVAMFCLTAWSMISLVDVGEQEVADRNGHLVLGLLARGVVAELDLQRVADAVDTGMADVFVAQQAAGRGLRALYALGQRGLGVDLHQEVHAAAQVEAEVHRQRVQALHPLRRVGLQVQRDQVGRIVGISVEVFFQHRLGLELDVRRGEARAHRGVGAGAVVADAFVRDILFFQRLGDAGHHVASHLDGRFAAGDLQGRRLAKIVGRRVQRTQQDGHDDDDVFPDRIAVHSVQRSM